MRSLTNWPGVRRGQVGRARHSSHRSQPGHSAQGVHLSTRQAPSDWDPQTGILRPGSADQDPRTRIRRPGSSDWDPKTGIYRGIYDPPQIRMYKDTGSEGYAQSHPGSHAEDRTPNGRAQADGQRMEEGHFDPS